MFGTLYGYAEIALSSTVVYIFIIAAIRLFGKKELAQLSVIDLVFILLISNSVQNAMVGNNTSLSGGIVAAVTLFIVNYIFKLALYRFPRLSRLIQGEPIMLVYDGKINKQNLERSKITNRELMEAIREHGVLDIEKVNLAVLEIDGSISVLSDEFRHKTVKRKEPKQGIKKIEQNE